MPRARSQAVSALVMLAPVLALACVLDACVLVQDLGSLGDPDPQADGASREGGAEDGSRTSDEDAKARSDAGVDAALDGPTGPGPLGALPSGYCCTSDEQCRFRRCAQPASGGGKMCLDACSTSRPTICKRPDLDFTCEASDAGPSCQPTASFACLDPATFVRGTKGTGGCCTDRQDGTTGRECEAYLCLALGAQDWFCTRRCDGDDDCPSDYRCYPVADRKECIPRVSPYACR